jgi:hypothetical protein
MTVEAAQGSRIALLRPANTNAALAFTTTMDTEVTRVFVCNSAASARSFRLYHVLAGASVGLDYALFYDKAVAANDTFEFYGLSTNGGIQLKEGDTLHVRSSNADDLTFHVYGVTASIAPGI